MRERKAEKRLENKNGRQPRRGRQRGTAREVERERGERGDKGGKSRWGILRRKKRRDGDKG